MDTLILDSGNLNRKSMFSSFLASIWDDPVPEPSWRVHILRIVHFEREEGKARGVSDCYRMSCLLTWCHAQLTSSIPSWQLVEQLAILPMLMTRWHLADSPQTPKLRRVVALSRQKSNACCFPAKMPKCVKCILFLGPRGPLGTPSFVRPFVRAKNQDHI